MTSTLSLNRRLDQIIADVAGSARRRRLRHPTPSGHHRGAESRNARGAVLPQDGGHPRGPRAGSESRPSWSPPNTAPRSASPASSPTRPSSPARPSSRANAATAPAAKTPAPPAPSPAGTGKRASPDKTSTTPSPACAPPARGPRPGALKPRSAGCAWRCVGNGRGRAGAARPAGKRPCSAEGYT